jgi:glycosyltransferase involved in cell wall biosynthesis
MNRLVDAYLAIGSLNRRYYIEHGVAKERIFMMPYAVDNARFMADAAKANASRDAFRAQLGIEGDRPILLFAAKLIERKRPAQLIEAFATVHADPAERTAALL